jgi:FMN phosphatase YigB (HAD superfamily)
VAEPDPRRQALLVDLDGTFYRGDGPVRSYATGVAAGLSEPDSAAFLSVVDGYLANGVSGSAEPELLAATDGWEAVQKLATGRFGVSKAALDNAFLASRAALARPDCAVEVPAGLLDLLARIRPSTRLVLATNSPATGLTELLTRLGARDAFDEVRSGAGKPAGLPALLAELAAGVGATGQPWRIFSIGDHWHNDIAPAAAFGARTGYVDRFGRADGPATVTAATLEGVLPVIEAWAADPEAFRAARGS